jgi:hypothetical protein
VPVFKNDIVNDGNPTVCPLVKFEKGFCPIVATLVLATIEIAPIDGVFVFVTGIIAYVSDVGPHVAVNAVPVILEDEFDVALIAVNVAKIMFSILL